MTTINWFPGHMAKTIKQLREEFKQADIIIECLDARIPNSSRNPIIHDILAEKHTHIIALTKTDLADTRKTNEFTTQFKQETPYVVELNLLKGKGVKAILETAKAISEKKRQSRRFYIAKVMVCGIPNVGKSALINKLAKKKATQVQNRPGVTKKNQGVMIGKFLELIDTPGILWPKITDPQVGIKLALTKAIKETIVDDYQLSEWLLTYLAPHYPTLLMQRYKLSSLNHSQDKLFETIATNMKWLQKNNEINENKLHRSFIEDFQKLRIGKITLDQQL